MVAQFLQISKTPTSVWMAGSCNCSCFSCFSVLFMFYSFLGELWF